MTRARSLAGEPGGRLRRATAILAAGAVAAGVAGSAWLLTTRPTFPRPTGSYPVAVVEVRLDINLAATGDARDQGPLPARIWHPVEPADQARPLILYAPSWGGLRNESDVLLAEIASHGFVVVATDDVSHDLPPTEPHDPQDEAARTGPFRLGSAAEFDAFEDIGRRRARLGREKLSRALDGLTALPRARLPSAIDLGKVAVLGFSHGGAVAGAALACDRRIKAAINLDGWIVGTEGMAIKEQTPLLAVYADPGPSPDPRPAADWVHAMTRLDFQAQLDLSRRTSARSLLIAGASHDDFKDTLYAPHRWLRWRPWRTDVIGSDEMRKALHRIVLAFLQDAVDGASAGRLEAAARHPAVRPLSPSDARGS